MRVLAIETSCDETAISILEFEDNTPVRGKILSQIVSSQIALHAPYGGVVPNLAKRAHQENLVPILTQALVESSLFSDSGKLNDEELEARSQKLGVILEREPELLRQTREFLPTVSTPAIDLIAVTYGPGLEPALWVGLNFAKALATAWDKPLMPVSHMEGHIYSSVLTSTRIDGRNEFELAAVQYPAVALLISGGHTELIKIDEPLKYELLGQTRDDAVGEAFDKVARILGLPYPGGPQISEVAQKFESQNSGVKSQNLKFPRPMLKSNDLDFSFSGLKTAVLYLTQKTELTPDIKEAVAFEFEQSVTEVVITKTRKAIEQACAESLLVGGGVIANKRIRKELARMCEETGTALYLPDPSLTGDNATMIALAGYFRSRAGEALEPGSFETLRASGTLRLHS